MVRALDHWNYYTVCICIRVLLEKFDEGQKDNSVRRQKRRKRNRVGEDEDEREHYIASSVLPTPKPYLFPSL